MRHAPRTSTLLGLTPLPLALAVGSALAGVNLIEDGGFEDGSLVWTSPRSALTLDPAAAEAGNGGLRIDSTFDWCPYGAIYALSPADFINGTLYEFGARVRLADGESGDARIWLGLIRNGADPIWIDGEQSSYDGRAYPDRWTTLYGVYKADFAPGDDLKLCVSGGKGKAVYLDNAYIAPLTPEQIGYAPPAVLDADDLVRASDNRLVLGADDATFILKGVNVYQYDPGDDSAPAADHFRYKNVNADAYAEIRALGFNSVRLMLSYKLFEEDAAPGVYKDEGFAVVDRHVQWAKANGLRLMLDMHVPPGGYQSASGFKHFGSRPDLQQRLEDLWAAIAERYRNETAIVGYDLINEPYVNEWFAYAETLIERIRTVDPNHLVVVEVSFHPNDRGMYRLSDDAVLYDVHWYEPWSWAGSHTNNTPYTGDLETFKQQLRDGEGLSEFYDAATDGFTVPFNIGEYGVVFEKYELPDVNGRQWLEDANAAFDHFGISRQLFAYNETNFGIYRGWNSYPREHTTTTEPLLAALPDVNGAAPPPPPPPVTETDLAATLTWSPQAPTTADPVTFSLGLGNLGQGATDARAEVALLAGMDLMSADAGCTDTGTAVSCSVQDLAPGDTRTWAITVRFTQAGTWVTSATAISDGLPDPHPANDQATAVVTVAEPPPPPPPASADVRIAAFGVDTPAPEVGSAFGVDFVVENLGGDTAATVALRLPLPAGVEWVSGASECAPSAGEVVCSFGDLAAWASRTRSVYLRPTAAGSLTLGASAESSTADPDSANNAAAVTVEVGDAPPPPSGDIADLSLTRFRSTTATPRVGRAAGFQFILKNLGDDPAVNTRFVLPLPAGMSWVSGPSECAVDGSEVVCSYGDLAKGVSRNRYLYLRPSVSGDTTLVGAVVSDTFDDDAGNNAVSVTINVRP
jgi:endoglucanase